MSMYGNALSARRPVQHVTRQRHTSNLDVSCSTAARTAAVGVSSLACTRPSPPPPPPLAPACSVGWGNGKQMNGTRRTALLFGPLFSSTAFSAPARPPVRPPAVSSEQVA